MASSVTEFFNGGIVTSRHPALLQEGELQRADDCIYRDNDSAIWRHPGRVQQADGGDWANAPVKGMMHLTFEGTRADQMLVYAGSRLYYHEVTSVVTGHPGGGAPAAPLDAGAWAPVTSAGILTGNVAYNEWPPPDGGATNPQFWTLSVTQPTSDLPPFDEQIIGATFRPLTYQKRTGAGPTYTYVTTPAKDTDGVQRVTGFQYYVSGNNTVYQLRFSAWDQYSETGGTPAANDVPVSYTVMFDHGVPITLANDGDEILGGVFYGKSYVIWNGKNSVYRLDWRSRATTSNISDILAAKPLGLKSVNNSFTVEAANPTGLWPQALGTGVYWFLVTELCEINSGGITQSVESAYTGKRSDSANAAAGDPIPYVITSYTNSGVKITPPIPVNTGADGRISTHFAVYMGGPTGSTAEKPSLATFRRVYKQQIKSYSDRSKNVINLTDNKLTPNNNADVVYYPTEAVARANRNEFFAPSRMLGEQNTGLARTKSGGSNSGNASEFGAQLLKTFKYKDPSGIEQSLNLNNKNVVGIQISVVGCADPEDGNSNDAGYLVYPVYNSGTEIQGTADFRHFSSDTLRENISGGETTLWNLPAINAGAQAEGYWGVVIEKTGTGAKQCLQIDSISVRFTLGSNSINLNGVPYRVVTYRDQVGMTINDPANLPPPNASTGDFFQGSLVLNNARDEAALFFSLAGTPEAFPKPYYMRFNTKKRDTITYIKRLGTALIVGMKESIKRVNYLPRETDTDMQSGVAHEDIASDHGIAGPDAAVPFDMPGEGSAIAYVNSTGVYMTNGIYSRPLSLDLDWENTVKLSALSTCVFRCNPKEKWLALYYCPAGATHNKNTRVLYFCYQADKIKGGSLLPVVGPAKVSGRAVCEAVVDGKPYIFTANEESGKIFAEDVGVSLDPGNPYQVRNNANAMETVQIVPVIRTRKVYHAGYNRDCRIKQILVLYSPYGTRTTTNAEVAITAGSATITVPDTNISDYPVGARITHPAIPLNAVIASKTDNGDSTWDIVLTAAASATASNASVVLDTGAMTITTRGSYVNNASTGTKAEQVTMSAGDLLSCHSDHIRQGMELQFEKVAVGWDADNNSTAWADLSTNMRLHHHTAIISDEGAATNRTSL